MSSANTDSFTSSFSYLDVFFPSCELLCVEILVQCWIKTAPLSSCSGGQLHKFAVRDDASCGVVLRCPSLDFRSSPLILLFFTGFIMRQCWILLKCLCSSVEIIMCFLSGNTAYDIELVSYVKPRLHSWNNPTWSWHIMPLICCWVWFAGIFLRIFGICIHNGYWSVVFLWYFCLALVSG